MSCRGKVQDLESQANSSAEVNQRRKKVCWRLLYNKHRHSGSASHTAGPVPCTGLQRMARVDLLFNFLLPQLSDPKVGLQFGSYCSIVHIGVYGCRPYVDVTKQPGFNLPAPFDCTGSPAGTTPVSIVGASRDFYANEPICSGSRYGNCPGIQDGLDQDSVCSLVSYKIHGCIFNN